MRGERRWSGKREADVDGWCMCRRCVGVRNLELGMSHPRLGISTLAELRLEYLELLVKSLEFGNFQR